MMCAKKKFTVKIKEHYFLPCLSVIITLMALMSLNSIPACADTAIKNIGAGIGPHAVAVNPATNKIYVSNYLGDNVTVIDGATDAVTATVPTGIGPHAVAVNPATNKIYVANLNSHNVTVIDGATNSTTTVPAGSYPHAVAVNPATNKIYVANENSNNVTVIDGATDSATATVSAGSNPWAVAVNPATNKIYVVNFNGYSVTVIDGATDTSMDTVSSGPVPNAVAINPATNKIYVSNYLGDNVTVIDGADDTVTATVPTGTNPRAVAVNPATNKIYIANSEDGNVTVIDGATDSVIATIFAGTSPAAVAVNPVTNRIYVANTVSRNVTVIDGAANTTATVPVEDSPRAVAVNPSTNKIYIANHLSDNVTVIDGVTNSTTTIPAGTSPNAVAVNPATNKIYIANSEDGNVTVIDGATGSAIATIPAGTSPYAVAVNPAINKIYVANIGSKNVTVIDGATDTAIATAPAGTSPNAIAVNPSANKIYVSNYTSHDVTVIDGATNSATATVSAGLSPNAIAVNPIANKIYVSNYTSRNVTVIDGATDTAIATAPAGTSPDAVAVNPITNRIYVANYNSNNVTVIDGATDTATATVSAGTNPYAVAVNPATNKIYVANKGSGNITVIDGATNATATVLAGDSPWAVAVNPATNKIYVANSGANNVTAIEEQPAQEIGPFVDISPLPGDVTKNLTPDFHFSALSAGPLPVRQIWFQKDTLTGEWQKALPAGDSADTTLTTLSRGGHILYAMATDDQDATSINTGWGNGIVTGKIAAYVFTVLEPAAVTSVTVPVDGAYTAGQNLDFTVNFSEAVNVDTTGGTPYIPITLNTGGTVNASYVGGSGTNSLVFSYTIAAGNEDANGITVEAAINANAGTIKDTSENDADLTLHGVGSTTGVLVDAVSPTLVSAARTDDTHITVTLSENCTNITKSNDGGFTVQETNTPGITYTVSSIAQGDDASHVVLTVADMGVSAKEGVTVKYTAGGNGTIRDTATNPMATDTTGVNVTPWDTAAPTITSGTLAADNSYIDITFSEGIYGADNGTAPLTADKLALTFVQNTGNCTNVQISSIKKNNSVTESSASALAGGETTTRVFLALTGTPGGVETIEIKPASDTSIYDKAGNAVSSSQTTGEKTLSDQLPPNVLSVTVPASGTYTVGQNLDFTVNFSEAVNVDTTGGTPYIPITLNTGGTVNASYISGSGTSSLLFRYLIIIGNLDPDGIEVGTAITANGAALKDAAGNDADLTLNNTGDTSNILISEGLVVTVPNGEEEWTAGSVQTIRWNYTDDQDRSVAITLLENGVVSQVISYRTPIGANGSGAYQWTIPPYQEIGNKYKILVSTYVNNTLTDTSDNDFSIVNPLGSPINVVTPNGGETWEAGSYQTIRWNYVGKLGQYVTIELLKDGKLDSVLAKQIPMGKSSAGDYKWRISKKQAAGDDYTIRVTCMGKESYADRSDMAFAITN